MRRTNSAEDWSISDRAVWSEENEVVGEIGSSDTEIRFCSSGPYVLEISAVRSDDWKAWFESSVEARCADEHINGILLAVITQATTFGNLVNLAIDDLDIRFAERLKVSNTWRQSSTSNRPVGNELLLEELVVQLFLHLLFHVAMGVGVGLCIFQEDAKLAVETSLNVLAVFEEDTRLAGKLVLLMLSEDVLFQTLDGRDPSWFADKCCDFVYSWLNVWKDLDT
jgi:hypothetical protein